MSWNTGIEHPCSIGVNNSGLEISETSPPELFSTFFWKSFQTGISNSNYHIFCKKHFYTNPPEFIMFQWLSSWFHRGQVCHSIPFHHSQTHVLLALNLMVSVTKSVNWSKKKRISRTQFGQRRSTLVNIGQPWVSWAREMQGQCSMFSLWLCQNS